MVQRSVTALVTPVLCEEVHGRLQLIDRRKVAVKIAAGALEKAGFDLTGDVELRQDGLSCVQSAVDVLVRLGEGVGADLQEGGVRIFFGMLLLTRRCY